MQEEAGGREHRSKFTKGRGVCRRKNADKEDGIRGVRDSKIRIIRGRKWRRMNTVQKKIFYNLFRSGKMFLKTRTKTKATNAVFPLFGDCHAKKCGRKIWKVMD